MKNKVSDFAIALKKIKKWKKVVDKCFFTW